MEPGLRLLLDTHALIWWLAGDEALSHRAREAIADEAIIAGQGFPNWQSACATPGSPGT